MGVAVEKSPTKPSAFERWYYVAKGQQLANGGDQALADLIAEYYLEMGANNPAMATLHLRKIIRRVRFNSAIL